MNWKPIAVACVAAAALAPRAEALQLEVTRAELCRVSHAVVVGRVADIDTHWTVGELGGLERRVVLEVSHTLAGSAGRLIDVVLPGGELGDFTHRVEDVPTLKADGTYMLFLEQTDNGWYVLGGEQGAVPVMPRRGFKGEPLDAAIASLEGCHAK